jgi:hypothetical protein
MVNGDKTAECLEMAAVKADNHKHEADDIERCVSEINCLCRWQFMNDYLMIMNFLHGVFTGQTGDPVEAYWLSPVEICSMTWSANNDSCQQL